MDDILEPPIENAFWINAMALLFGVTLPLPLIGMLSDYCGRVRIMVVGAIGLGAVGPIMMMVISHGKSVPAFFAQLTIGLLLTMYGGPISAWLVERFPAKVQLTSASLGYDLAHCTASAFAPLLAIVLAQNVGLVAPGIIYPFFAILGLVGMFISTKNHQEGGIEDRQADTSGVELEQKEAESEGELDQKGVGSGEGEGGEEPEINPIA